MAEVRAEAVDALSKLVDRGDPVAVAGVLRCLSHREADCRATAAWALTKARPKAARARVPRANSTSQVADHGNQAVVSALCAQLRPEVTLWVP